MKVMCVYNSCEDLTIGKIYDVIHLEKSRILPRMLHSILIINDKDEQQLYYIEDNKRVWFEDATPYIRDNKLNELGIDKQLNKIGI